MQHVTFSTQAARGGLCLLSVCLLGAGCSRSSKSPTGSSGATAGAGATTATAGSQTATTAPPSSTSPTSPTSPALVAPDGLRTIALSGRYFGRTAREVTLCSFDEDLRALQSPRLQIDAGAGFVDSPLPPTYQYFAINNGAHYTGNAGFLNFDDPAAISPTRRYRVLAERNGVTITSNVVVIPAGAPIGPVRVAEPAGAYDFLSPPQVSQAPRASWGPRAERCLVALYRVETPATPGGLGLAVEAVLEVSSPQVEWSGPTVETWVQGRTPLPSGRYALDVMNIDAGGWVTGWSTNRALGADAYYRFDVR